MSSIMIRDLAQSKELGSTAMSAVRGGNAWGPNVTVNLDQDFNQTQIIQVGVLNNNGVIGAGFVGPHVDVASKQWGMNRAALPSSMLE